MKVLVQKKMDFKKLQDEENEEELTNKLMDLTWLLQHDVKRTAQRRQKELPALPSGRPSLKSKADHENAKLKRNEKAKLYKQFCPKDRKTKDVEQF